MLQTFYDEDPNLSELKFSIKLSFSSVIFVIESSPSLIISILGIVFTEFRFVILVLLLLVANDDINVDSTMFVDEPTSLEILLVSVFGRRSLTLSNSLASSNENFFFSFIAVFNKIQKTIYKFFYNTIFVPISRCRCRTKLMCKYLDI